MKIGIDARMYRSGVAGIGRYSQNLIKNLLEINQKDEFILFMTSDDYRELKNPKSLPRRQAGKLQMTNKNSNVKIKITNIPHYSLAEQLTLPKIIEKENLDLMHFLNFNCPVRYGGKFVVTIHDLTLLFYPETARDTNIYKKLGFKYVMKKACRNAAKIIAVSENTKKDIIDKFQIPKSKIQTIYEAADDKIFGRVSSESLKSLREKYKINQPLILYVGQFRAHKNLIGLLKAFEILRSNFPCQLAILGKRDLNHQLKTILDKADYKDDIVMPGFVEDTELAQWYKIASVFVLPSFYEGFGLPGLEAMMVGTPVAASNQASLPEIYQDGAWYFDPFDTADIAGRIKEVLKDEKLRKNLIEKGKIIARSYSWRKTAEQTLDLYKQIQKS